MAAMLSTSSVTMNTATRTSVSAEPRRVRMG
jgi:hypothetical protein